MTSAPQDPDDEILLQIDKYKIKVHLEEAEGVEPRPTSLKDLVIRVAEKLPAIVLNVVGLVEDVIVGARRIIRGFSRLPGSVARRVENAHDKADRRESAKQQSVSAGSLDIGSIEDAEQRLQAILQSLRRDGKSVVLFRRNDGTQVLFVGDESRIDVAREIARDSSIVAPPPSGTDAARIYDALVGARTADKATIHFKDGRTVYGAVIFNPYKGSGRIVNIDQEISIDFRVDDIRDLKL